MNSQKPKRKAVQISLTPQQEKLVQLAVLAGEAKSKASFCMKAVEQSLKTIQVWDLIHKVQAMGMDEELKRLGLREIREK
jgi:hypothetical protein